MFLFVVMVFIYFYLWLLLYYYFKSAEGGAAVTEFVSENVILNPPCFGEFTGKDSYGLFVDVAKDLFGKTKTSVSFVQALVVCMCVLCVCVVCVCVSFFFLFVSPFFFVNFFCLFVCLLCVCVCVMFFLRHHHHSPMN